MDIFQPPAFFAPVTESWALTPQQRRDRRTLETQDRRPGPPVMRNRAQRARRAGYVTKARNRFSQQVKTLARGLQQLPIEMFELIEYFFTEPITYFIGGYYGPNRLFHQGERERRRRMEVERAALHSLEQERRQLIEVERDARIRARLLAEPRGRAGNWRRHFTLFP